MDGPRDEGDRLYGPPRISLIPYQGHDDGLPALHTSRVTDQTPNFYIAQFPETWYPPTTTVRPQPLSWDVQRRHKRWLRHAHPEAITGLSELLSDLMTEQDDDAAPVAAPAEERQGKSRPLLAIAQMTDKTIPKQSSSKPILAVAAGDSGELVRIVALSETNWQWGEHPDPSMRLLRADRDDPQEQALWSSAQDESPVTQVKTALSLGKHETSRYVLVQKAGATTVLRPRYRKVPVSTASSGKDVEKPSRVDPNPVLVIANEQTGGSSHSDVAFNPGGEGRPDQLAIVDERGYWSVWEVQGRILVGRFGLEVELRYGGHVQAGFLDELPRQPDTFIPARPHGILWIGQAEPDWNHWDAPLGPSDVAEPGILGSSSFRATPRRRRLVVWNSSHFELVDLRRNNSEDHSLQLLKTQQDRILAVQSNPVNQSQVFVLTTSTLFWLDLLPSRGETTGEPQEPSILLSCAHLRGPDNDSLHLRAHQGLSGRDQDESVVCLHSSASPDVDIFTFGLNEQSALPYFQHHTLRIPSTGPKTSESSPGLQTVCLAPAPLTALVPDGPGSASFDRGDRFWQLFVLNRDLGVECTIVTATLGGILDVRLPDVSPDLSRRHQRRVRSRRRKHLIQGLAETFVVPDGFGDMEDLVRQQIGLPQDDATTQDIETSPRRRPRGPVEGIEMLMSRVAVSMETVAMESQHISATGEMIPGFDSVRRAIESSLDEDAASLPLTTLRDHGAAFEAPPPDEAVETAWNAQLQALLHLGEQRVASESVVPEFLGINVLDGVPLQAMRRQLEQRWFLDNGAPAARSSRQLVISETAEAALRSLYGVVVFDLDTSSTIEGLTSWVPEPRSQEPPPEDRESPTQREAYPTPRLTQSLSPGPPSSSRPTSRGSGISSSRASRSPSRGSRDQLPESIQRLSMLAAKVNPHKDIPGPRHPVLSYWPDKRGVSTDGYLSTIQTASTQRVDQARTLSRKHAARKRQKRHRIMGGGAGGGGGGGAEAFSSVMDPLASSSRGAPIPIPMPASSQTLPPTVGAPRMATTPAVPKTQLPPRIQPVATVSSSQMPQSSQSLGVGLGQTMSQPMAGHHGRRPPQQQLQKKKKKRRGGF